MSGATPSGAAATSSRSRWFQALALWKAAVFCEAIYGRYIRGELAAEDTNAARFEQGPLLAETALASSALETTPQLGRTRRLRSPGTKAFSLATVESTLLGSLQVE